MSDETARVHIRIMGDPLAVKAITGIIKSVTDPVRESESYPVRHTKAKGRFVRRYLIVKVPKPVKWVKGMRRI